MAGGPNNGLAGINPAASFGTTVRSEVGGVGCGGRFGWNWEVHSGFAGGAKAAEEVVPVNRWNATSKEIHYGFSGVAPVKLALEERTKIDRVELSEAFDGGGDFRLMLFDEGVDFLQRVGAEGSKDASAIGQQVGMLLEELN